MQVSLILKLHLGSIDDLFLKSGGRLGKIASKEYSVLSDESPEYLALLRLMIESMDDKTLQQIKLQPFNPPMLPMALAKPALEVFNTTPQQLIDKGFFYQTGNTLIPTTLQHLIDIKEKPYIGFKYTVYDLLAFIPFYGSQGDAVEKIFREVLASNESKQIINLINGIDDEALRGKMIQIGSDKGLGNFILFLITDGIVINENLEVVKVFQVKYWCRTNVEPKKWDTIRERAMNQVDLLMKERSNLKWPTNTPFDIWIFSPHYSNSLDRTPIVCQGDVRLNPVLHDAFEFYLALPKEIQAFMAQFSKVFENLKIKFVHSANQTQ